MAETGSMRRRGWRGAGAVEGGGAGGEASAEAEEAAGGLPSAAAHYRRRRRMSKEEDGDSSSAASLQYYASSSSNRAGVAAATMTTMTAWQVAGDHWRIAALAACGKALLVGMYHSTDMEVHRNWMAVVWNTPPAQWYHEATSQWTLDYPPGFAYFEWVLAAGASFLAPQALSLSATPVETPAVVAYMRGTAIAADVVLYLGLASLIAALRLPRAAAAAAVALTLGHVGLIFVDHIHFQYNGALLGLLAAATAAALRRAHTAAFATLAALVACKHLFIVVVPAFVALAVADACNEGGTGTASLHAMLRELWRPVAAAGAVVVACVTPVLLSPADSIAAQGGALLHRLFPFHRGLVHAYWAPNVWAAYLAADKVVGAVVSRLLRWQPPQGPPAQSLHATPTVLPAIPPTLPLLLQAGASLAIMAAIIRAPGATRRHAFYVGMLAAYGVAFAIGWHVHEKAVLYIIVPALVAAVAAVSDARPDAAAYPDTSRCDSLPYIVSAATAPALMSLWPLLFTPVEQVFVAAATLAFTAATWGVLGAPHHPVDVVLAAAAVPVALLYWCHTAIVPHLPFLHLAVMSLYATPAVLLAVARLARLLLSFSRG